MLTAFLAALTLAPQDAERDRIYDQLQAEERMTPEVLIVQAVALIILGALQALYNR